MNDSLQLRGMTPADRDAVADLIYRSTNTWYTTAGKPPIFQGEVAATAVFFDVYQALLGSAGIVVEDAGALVGSCFYHVRPTHVSLGIMNVHPDHFREGIASHLLREIILRAEREKKPLRLVSSAMNLDSFSLYTRHGFVPRTAYQDMIVNVPAEGIDQPSPLADRVRPATISDIEAVAELEMAVSHIRRENDYRHFINNEEGFWHVSVIEDDAAPGTLAGVLASSAHPASNMIGPGVAKTAQHAAALIRAELNQHKGRSPVFLVPVECAGLVRDMYDLGARNCELHFTQVRGDWPGIDGVNMPTFMPETG